MTKFRLCYDVKEEAEFLNEMCRQGWAVTKFFAGFYTFEECELGRYVYQVDCTDKWFDISESYRSFMNEINIDIVYTWGPWVILRKEASAGEFDLYTDVDSQIEQQKKISRVYKIGAISESVYMLYVAIAYALTENSVYISLLLLALSLVIVFANALRKVNNRIDELVSRQTGIESNEKKPIRLLIAAGCLMNSCALVMNDGSLSDWLVRTVQIIAIIMMATGLFFTCKDRFNKES